MERLFSPCTRLRDMIVIEAENQQENLGNDSSDDSSTDDSSSDDSPPDDSSSDDSLPEESFSDDSPPDDSPPDDSSSDDDPPEPFRELNLDVSIDEFLSTESGFTYADL